MLYEGLAELALFFLVILLYERDFTHRVSQQISDQLPEKPQIALILRTDDCRMLESKIQIVFKEKGKRIEDAIGKEWFLTSPSEVLAIYQQIEV